MTYNVKTLNTNQDTVVLLVNRFNNLCNSLVKSHIYGANYSSFTTLTNLALLLNKVKVNELHKDVLSEAVQNLFNDQEIVEIIFSVILPEYEYSTVAFLYILQFLHISNINIIHKMVNSKYFFDYAANVDFKLLRELILNFLNEKDNGNMQDQIQNIIEQEDNLYHKITLLRIFYKKITRECTKKYYDVFLSSVFEDLPADAIYDFVLVERLTVSNEMANIFMNKILKNAKPDENGEYQLWSNDEEKLLCVYILYIEEIIKDISQLEPLKTNRPHLQFLLDPENFDYSQVDFSNGMWVNFAKYEKYIKYFIFHKDSIKPGIINKIKNGKASDDEKRILYGFLLDGDEVWDY